MHYVFLNDIECRGRILGRLPSERFIVEYFDNQVEFAMQHDEELAGTNLTMSCYEVRDEERVELTAGWVSWLLASEVAVELDIDIRNHHPKRSWMQGFVDN